jgi:tetratricopeptide (TPR) repeat protein
VIALKPNSAAGYMMLASIYESQNDIARAIAEVANGLRVDRGNLQAMLVLGNLYARKGDYRTAMQTYSEALARSPEFVPALFAQASLMETMNNKQEAIRKYREVLTKSDSYVPAINNLAYLYVDGDDRGNHQEGLRLAFSAYKLDQENPGVMDTLGYALLKNGRGAEAQKILEKTVLLLPTNPTVHYHLALAYKETGMRDMAGKTLQKSLSLGDFPEAGKARKLLETMKKS